MDQNFYTVLCIIVKTNFNINFLPNFIFLNKISRTSELICTSSLMLDEFFFFNISILIKSIYKKIIMCSPLLRNNVYQCWGQLIKKLIIIIWVLEGVKLVLQSWSAEPKDAVMVSTWSGFACSCSPIDKMVSVLWHWSRVSKPLNCQDYLRLFMVQYTKSL